MRSESPPGATEHRLVAQFRAVCSSSILAETLERVMYFEVSTYGTRSVVVIPVHAGIQAPPDLDPGVRRDDVSSIYPCTWENV